MHIYTITDTAALIALRALAIFTAVGYARWHYWWRNAFGLSFMAILFTFASRIPDQIATLTAPQASDRIFDTLEDLELAGTILAVAGLSYLLYATVALNIRRVRAPAKNLARKYLEQTPASTDEIQALLDCWDILHMPKTPNSAASVHPDQET